MPAGHAILAMPFRGCTCSNTWAAHGYMKTSKCSVYDTSMLRASVESNVEKRVKAYSRGLHGARLW